MTTSNRLPSVGFIGLGVMGRPMATHLARAGCTMHLLDARPGMADEIAAVLPGARAAATPAALARECEIVITMVPNGEVVHQLVTGANGLRDAMAPGSLLLDTSSSEQLWRAAALQNTADASVSELARWVERTSGTEIRAGTSSANEAG